MDNRQVVLTKIFFIIIVSVGFLHLRGPAASASLPEVKVGLSVSIENITQEPASAISRTAGLVSFTAALTSPINTIYLPIVIGGNGTISPSPLPTPVLLTPLEGTTQSHPTFDWTDVSGATGYHFQLAADKDFSQLILDEVVTTSEYILANDLNGAYYWRVYAIDATNKSDYSESWSITLISLTAPTLLAPAEGSSQINFTFDWTEVISATSYKLELSSTSDFGTIAFSHIATVSELAYISELAGTYYWRVQALTLNGAIVGPYSEVRSLQLALPVTPILIAPANGSLQGVSPLFDWTNVAEATAYHIQISEVSNFSNLVIAEKVIDSHYTSPSSLKGFYYWRVYAEKGSSNSDYSDVWTVHLISLESPTLLAPAEGSSQTNFTFDWTDVISATSYNLELSSTSDFSSIAFSQTTPVSQLDYATTLNGFYYWRVKALNGTIIGPYSAVRSLQLLAPNSPPLLLAPANGSHQAKPAFDWTDAVSVTGYHLQISPTSDFATLLSDQSVNESNYTFLSTQSGLYYWRVYATDGQTNGPFSEVWTVQLVDYNSDEDGDSLPNGWELHGYDHDDDGVIDVDLPALGADYRHKDVFVEMDYMPHPNSNGVLAPNQSVIDRIIAVFANGPISNPDGVDGINLHLELDDEVPLPNNSKLTIPYDNGNVGLFYAYKDQYFAAHRLPVYHYMIWAYTYAGHTSTKPFATGISPKVPGAEFIVTLGKFNNDTGGTDDEKVNTFTHELGHNLGLAHGGSGETNYKPNYFSQMNYWWSISGMLKDGGHLTGYQPFSLPSLNENSLNEAVGLNAPGLLAGYTTSYYCPDGSTIKSVPANGPIDWNCDGDTVDTNVSSDINKDGSKNNLNSQNDWANLRFDGGKIGK